MVYEAKPVVRDLRKEATRASFMPSSVRQKRDAIKGHHGKLLEPEEMDRLEKEGYGGIAGSGSGGGAEIDREITQDSHQGGHAAITVTDMAAGINSAPPSASHPHLNLNPDLDLEDNDEDGGIGIRTGNDDDDDEGGGGGRGRGDGNDLRDNILEDEERRFQRDLLAVTVEDAAEDGDEDDL